MLGEFFKYKSRAKIISMELKYLGHSSFRIKANKAVVVTDPFDPDQVGLSFPKVAADIVTISHHHFDHDAIDRVSGSENREKPLIFDAPGEYEATDIGVVGIAGFHDDKGGEERGKNTMFVFQVDGILVAHLGDIGHQLTEKQIEDIGPVDVLLVPVGGTYTLDPSGAAKVIEAISPSIVVPMHYKVPGLKDSLADLVTVDEFLSKSGLDAASRTDKLKITRETLPAEMEVVILNP